MTGRKPYLIAIAGPSCSGKSLLARHLAHALSAPVITLDSYYRDRSDLPFPQRAWLNFDTPEAFDLELLLAHLRLLAGGAAIEKPVYDFGRHTRTAEVERIEPGNYVIVEGILSLHREEMRVLYGIKVFLSVPDAVCLERRMDRDIRERGRTAESVEQQYLTTVRPAAEQYILPTMRYADVLLSGEEAIDELAAAVLEKIKRQAGPPACAGLK